jgi:L-serine dehydratase
MRAGNNFLETIQGLDAGIIANTRNIEVRLYGSLSATGKGHGTDRAILAGLLGQKPETVSSSFLDGLLKETASTYDINVGPGKRIPVTGNNIIFDKVVHNYPFSNTIVMRLTGPNGILFEREYYSVGGGFIQWKGWSEPDRGKPVYPYGNMAQLRQQLVKHNIRLHELILQNEKSITGATDEKIHERLDLISSTMLESVKNGLDADGLLPGPCRMHRKASGIYRGGRKKSREEQAMIYLSAYAIACAEENAAGHKIVTAPTAGSAGVMPAILQYLKYNDKVKPDALRNGLLASAAIGFLAKHNASIAGAEVGCQGEIGVASSMAAALLAYSAGCRIQVVENASLIALEHHLGMTCDPVGGYVQIPCIERCAMGAVKAMNAYLIASVEAPEYQKVSFDVVVRAMAATGRDMSSKYKETSQGGLAVYMVNC